jgi:hypothetical protein
MAAIARIESLATEIASAFEYDKALAKDVARSNLITFYNQAIEDAARVAEKAVGASDRILIGTIIRGLSIVD